MDWFTLVGVSNTSSCSPKYVVFYFFYYLFCLFYPVFVSYKVFDMTNPNPTRTEYFFRMFPVKERFMLENVRAQIWNIRL